MSGNLDHTDLKIISGLSKDANVSYAELAAACGVTRQTIASRVKRLEKEGVIKRYRAVIDYGKLGLKSYFILFLKLDVSDEARMKEFIASIKNDPSVLMDVSITGEWDVMLLLAFCNVKEYEYYINSLRVRMGPLLKDSKSHVILDFYKSPDDYVPAS
ncbi:Transcriptional regulator, MarR family [Methanocella conradii HZ254]|uniref:Transcriptional regulator, MarR family n=1 Tax=Methanocella conradii (strain DSM 24694 / JCM 17849 / CGMCC 1.5162 / HZ254) TaxID=1041930 RepID=H8I6W8_METCZ|nr:Lrp/AsnC family transcriptional regulator [Methanocella conradii]AFC99798.1 Transcriptional regulator, MarR family [Methanocella conradii HZ254]MDI6896486.1 Lrp/AsnC family transcriptional regulator [Methanocella conradii]